jgi:hypothetical protein
MQFLMILNIVFFLLSAETVRAEPPIIWNGDYAFNLAPNGYEQNSGRQLRDCGSTVPSAGGGLAAPIGSFCQYSSGALGAMYIKVGAADTAWTNVLGGTTGWALAGNAGTTAGTDFVGTTDAQDLVIKRNSAEIARAQASGWEAATVLGSSSSGGNLTLRSTSNATVGSVLIANQATEKTRIGNVGASTTFNGLVEMLTASGTNSRDNALIVRDNGADFPTDPAAASSSGFQFAPRGTAGVTEIITRTNGDVGLWRNYRSGDGTAIGKMAFGLPWGFANSNAALTTLEISGFNLQTADIVRIHNATDWGGVVSSIGSGGQYRGPVGTVSLPTFAGYTDTNTGMWFPAADTLAWSLAGAEELRLDATGLGIDTTPAAKLDVNGSARIRGLNSVGVVTTDADGDLSTNANLPASLGGRGTAIQEARTGTFGGVDTTYTLTQTPLSNADVTVFLGTVIQRQGTDYSIAGTTITFAAQDTSSQSIYAVYRY